MRCPLEFLTTPIPPSGVWDPIEVEHDTEQTLLIHREPWGSAPKSTELTWSLIEKDLKAGHLFELLGGEEEARALWRTKVAAGKFGVVCAEGRKPRLIGDGTVSGTKAASQISEVRLPNLESVQRFVSANSGTSWTAWTWDVRGAHKLVKVARDEQGFQCFTFQGRWFVYRCCYFGARWSAFWFSRAGSFILRLLHRFFYIAHAAFLYVDDCFLSATQSRRITLGLLWYHVSLRIGCASVLGKIIVGPKVHLVGMAVRLA